MGLDIWDMEMGRYMSPRAIQWLVVRQGWLSDPKIKWSTLHSSPDQGARSPAHYCGQVQGLRGGKREMGKGEVSIGLLGTETSVFPWVEVGR